jgi:DHA3 family macrolide efflux protein-like MFS transporter
MDAHSGWKKQITIFLISQNLSLFGSSVVGFAILWHITLETSSGVWMMLWTICTLLPQVLISLFAGVWADRYNRKLLIMLADGFTALATLVLAISFLLGFRKLELLLIASVARAIGAGVQTPAVSAIYPQLVPKERLTKVQGINQTLSSGLALLSPAVGGLLLGTVGIVGAFFVDVVTAVLAILVMSRIHVEQPPKHKEIKSMWQDISAGISCIYGHDRLRRLIICVLFSFLFITPAFTLNPLMIERTFGNEVWRLTVHEIIWSIAMIISGIFVSIKGQFRNKPQTISICIVGFGITFGLLGMSWNFASFLVFLGISGLFWPVLSAAQTVFVQETAPPEMLGRVFSVIQLIITGVVPIAILFFGPLADIVRIETIYIISSTFLALVGMIYGLSEKQAKKR